PAQLSTPSLHDALPICDAPIALPTLKSLSRSVAWPAAPPAELALIRLIATCPGATAPNASCDSLPIAPIGGMPVVPTTRAATIRSEEHTSELQSREKLV